MVTPVPYVPSALRKSRGSIGELSVANSLAGSAGCLGRSDIQASERQIFGRQADRDAAVIGPRRIEIECEMGVNRMRITELALQRSRGEEAARTARGEQQRDRLGAEVDGEGAVAPQPCLFGDIRDVAAPGI